MATVTGDLLECGVAASTMPGETIPGDCHFIKTFDGGTLVAVIDGLGHGRDAGAVAAEAVRTIEQCSHDSVVNIIQACHEALRATRGVVMSVASFCAREGTMAWAGVGNVEGVLLRAAGGPMHVSSMLLTRSGIVGLDNPRYSEAVVSVTPGDTLILATDGLRAAFWQGCRAGDSPQRTSDRILAEYTTGADDAMVLTARYCGPRS